MKIFFSNALKHAKSERQKLYILLAASQAKALSDRDYFGLCERAK